MNKVVFDFADIGNIDDFYMQFVDTFELPDYFGNNLDALWDVITSGEIPLPITIEFINLPDNEVFENLVNLFEQAEDELDGDLVFIHPYQDEEEQV